jgi:hypothetical protein
MFLLEIVIDHNLVYWAEVNHYQLPVLIEKYGRVSELQIWSLRVELTFLDLLNLLLYVLFSQFQIYLFLLFP